jgi:hypothetical protein
MNLVDCKKLLGSLLATLALAACQPGEQAEQPWTISVRGYGPVHAGMTLAEAATAGGLPLGEGMLGTEDCDYVYFAGDSTGDLHFMVINGQIARVDVQDSTVTTGEGARIGDTEDRVKQLYPGRVTVEPHKYTDGHYLVVAPEEAADSSFRIIFETDSGRVTTYRAGRLPEVALVEGCS